MMMYPQLMFHLQFGVMLQDFLNGGKDAPGNLIVGMIRWFGIAIIVGAMIVKGIKFVSVSPEGKAEIKKELIMLTIGAVIIFALTTIFEIIIKIVQNAGLQ